MNGRRYVTSKGKTTRIYRKRTIEGYTDGIVKIYQSKEHEKTSFNAVKNPDSVESMDFVASLRFNTKRRRDNDVDFAESHDRTLSMKIVTPLLKKVKTLHYAVIGDTLYTAYMVDYDDVENEMYLYLEEIRQLC